MKKYRVLLITHQLLLSVIYAAAVDHDSEPGMETIAKLDHGKLPKTDAQVHNPGGPPGGPALMEFETEGMPKQPILDVPVPMEASDSGASLANQLLAQAVVEQEEKAEECDADFSLKNPRKSMRLSAEIEAADLRPFAPKSVDGYIRFFFLDDLATEIGRLPFSKLRRSARTGISDDIPIPSKKFAIAYDFRSAKDEPLSSLHWICNSVRNKDGFISPVGIYEEEIEEKGKKQKIKIRNKLGAIRLKAFIGGQSKEDPFIRMGLVACKYSEGKPLLKPVEKQELAPEKTMFDDVALITEAIQKYGKKIKDEVAVVDPGESTLGSNNYASFNQKEIELPDYSIAIAGEYIRLAQQKYNKIVCKADAPKLIALFRNYGVVTRATADELADYLGLK